MHLDVAAGGLEDRFAANVVRTNGPAAGDAADITADFAERDIAARCLRAHVTHNLVDVHAAATSLSLDFAGEVHGIHGASSCLHDHHARVLRRHHFELRHFRAALHHQIGQLTLPRDAHTVGAEQPPGLGFIAGLHALDHGIRKLIPRSAFDTHATDGADSNIAARGNLL